MPVNCVVFFIFIYKKTISAILPPMCRFYPSCSDYAAQAFLKYGFFKGSFLTARRLLKCHPFCDGGVDELI